MKKLMPIFFQLVFLALPLKGNVRMTPLPQACQNKNSDFEQKLECAQNHFVVDGQRINPKIIQDLESWLSDSGTQVFSVSLLESQKSNRYFCGENCDAKNGKEDYNYALIGKMDNEIFVLKTTYWGGGAGVFENLLLVRIHEGRSLGDIQPQKNDALLTNHRMILIEKLGSYPLGDRKYSEISIKGKTIEIARCPDGVNVCDNQIKEKFTIGF